MEVGKSWSPARPVAPCTFSHRNRVLRRPNRVHERTVKWRQGLVLVLALHGCAHLGGGEAEAGDRALPRADVAMPAEPMSVRDDRTAPILNVATAGEVVYLLVYGYPLYPAGDAARGIRALRTENAAGARHEDREDAAGVVHAVEVLPQLGCRFDGVREDPVTYVPVSLTCELPAPKMLGGNNRPVLDGAPAGARPEQILREPSVREVFLGEFHMSSDGFESGSGTGYFNTTHGQLALEFVRKKLERFVYYFDPSVKGWRDPATWTTDEL